MYIYIKYYIKSLIKFVIRNNFFLLINIFEFLNQIIRGTVSFKKTKTH